MPQIDFPVMVSIDWLEIFCESNNPITDALSTPDYMVQSSPDVPCFHADMREFGCKMWQFIQDVYILQDGVFVLPFCTVCSGLRGKSANPKACSIKLANEMLYRKDKWSYLQAFRDSNEIFFCNISRCDLAADFLFLHGRVSGKQLINNIKSLKWWKCGSANVAEHYSLPYSIKWAQVAEDMEIESFDRQGSLALRTESMTFGTKSSFAQVIIYDKTLELATHSVDGVSSKEYIRDCWKEVGVYDDKRHTWRVEIRLNSKAATIKDPYKADGLRPLQFKDLQDDTLYKTFKSAADVWFRLVDASADGRVENITPEYCETMRKHKERLKVVTLFNWESLRRGFVHKPSAPTPSRFTKAMINKLSETSLKMRTNRLRQITKHDHTMLDLAANILLDLYTAQRRQEDLDEKYMSFEDCYRQIMLNIRKRQSSDRSNFSLTAAERKFLDFFNDKHSPLSADRKLQIDEEVRNRILD